MHRWTPRFGGLAISVLLFATVGCGESVYKVHGNVTFEGKPLAGGGSISFVPINGDRLRPAGGEIRDDGTYEVSTIKPGDGAMAGEYRVVITQVTEKEPPRSKDGEAPPPRGNLSLPLADRIPTKFGDAYQSPLTAKVEAKAVNEINFPLKRD